MFYKFINEFLNLNKEIIKISYIILKNKKIK